MNVEEILGRTLAEHADDAPDADAALAGIHERLDRPRRTGPVLVAAAAVVAVVIGAALLVHRDPAPTAAARPAPTATPVPSTVTPISFSVGWLPAGTLRYPGNGYLDNDTDSRGFDVHTADGTQISIITAVWSRPATGGEQLGPRQDVTIDGRPARQWSAPGQTMLTMKLSATRWAFVDVQFFLPPDYPRRGDATPIAQRILAGMRFDGIDSARPAFGLTWLPAGLPVALKAGDATSGLYVLQAPGQHPNTGPALVVASVPESQLTIPGFRPGKPVQGHPTLQADGPDGPILYVEDYLPGSGILLSPGERDPHVSLAQLYQLAGGLRLS